MPWRRVIDGFLVVFSLAACGGVRGSPQSPVASRELLSWEGHACDTIPA